MLNSTDFIASLCLYSRYGRKPALIFTNLLQTTFIFLQIFSPSWPVLCVLLFVSSLGQVANYVSAFVLGTWLRHQIVIRNKIRTSCHTSRWSFLLGITAWRYKVT